MLELLPAIIRLILTDLASAPSNGRNSPLPSKNTATWQSTINELRMHRLTPLTGYTMRSLGIDHKIPAPVAATLAEDYRKTLLANSLLMRTLRELLAALAKAGIQPIILKGSLLATIYYPDTGTRPLGDVDLLVRPEESSVIQQTFTSMGFVMHGNPETEDAIYYRNDQGMSFDIHYRFMLFPPEIRDQISEEVTITDLGELPVKHWEPNAQLVHLLVHLLGHRQDSGFMLGWLLDLAFVVRHEGARLCPDRIKSLMPDPKQEEMLWKALGFLSDHGDIVIPESLQSSVASVRPLNLLGVLRDRRLARWGLPGIRGWLRMLACRMKLKSPPRASYPSVGDLAQSLLRSGRE